MLPPPLDFHDGERRYYGRFIVGAGVAVGVASIALVAILTWGGWPATLYPTIVAILGRALIGAGAIMALVIVFLGLGGPVRSLKATFGKASIETEGD